MQNIRTIRYCFILFLSVLVSCKGQTDKLNDNCPMTGQLSKTKIIIGRHATGRIYVWRQCGN